MIQKASHIRKPDGIGAKAWNLVVLRQEGFHVPDFIVVPFRDLEKFFVARSQDVALLEQELRTKVPWELSAVRSSIVGEDTHESSQAGQYPTELRVAGDDLVSVVEKVFTLAKQKKPGTEGSIIVQKFIEPDVSGVCFTRDRRGGWGMRISMVKGHNSDLVSDKETVEELTVFSARSLKGTVLPDTSFMIFEKIEQFFKTPQDIEWVVVGDKLSVVQSRPITTLSPEIIAGFDALDTTPLGINYFLESITLVAGLVAHPVPLSRSIFDLMYRDDGAVHQVYRDMDCILEDYESPLVDIGGRLYIDKQREVKNILPTYRYVDSYTKPRSMQFRGLMRSIKNARKIKRFLHEPSEDEFTRMRSYFDQPFPETFETWRRNFIDQYADIYRINLRAQYYMEQLEQLAEKEKLVIQHITSLTSRVLKETDRIAPVTGGWIGNGLDIADTLPFREEALKPPNDEIRTWFENQPEKTQHLVTEALRTMRYREYARWLSVRSMGTLRRLMREQAELTRIPLSDLPYVSLQEFIDKTWTTETIATAKETYRNQKRLAFPDRIADIQVVQEPQSPRIIAGGMFMGRVVSRGELEKNSGLRDVVVVTETLDPELIGHVDRLTGVLAVHGSYLAHFAILAREAGLPTVVLGPRAHDFVGEMMAKNTESFVIKD